MIKPEKIPEEIPTLDFKKINYKKFIEENFMILDRETQVPIPFKLNKVQNKYYQLLKDNYGGKLDGVRDIILKARQQGMSSFILALFTVDFLMRPHSVSVCISHRKDSTDFLFKKVKFYLDCYINRLAERTGKDVDVLKKEFFKSNNKNLLENELNGASFYILTAGAKVGGRGNSARNVLFCVGEDTRIILPSGQTKEIKNINVGDEVISRFGEKTTVTNKWDSGMKPMKRMKLWLSNESIEVSPDHKVMTIDGWKQAKDLTTQDYVEWSYTRTSEIVRQISIPRIKNCVHLKNDINGLILPTDFKLGYFLGYYLAEGHISKNLNRLSFTCHKDEIFYDKFIDLFPIKPKIKIRDSVSGIRKVITYNSKELASFVHNLLGRVSTKNLPHKFLATYPKEFLRGVYDGYSDGDGSKTQLHHTTMTSIHEKIARQIRQLGMVITNRVFAVDYYPDRFRYGKRTKPVYLVRKHGSGLKNKNYLKYKKKNNNFYINIQSIQDAPDKQTYEIEVKNKSHAYLTVGGVIANSEAAFYQDTELVTAQEMIMATSQMVPQDRGMIFMESTANGEGNYYHKTWEKSSDGESSYIPVFFGWREFYTQEWIEKKKKSFTNLKMFMQEYPETPEEAFITSGTPFFDVVAIKEMEQHKMTPQLIGRFATGGYFERSEHEEDAMVKIYREIAQDEQMVVFADPADGQDYCAAVACSKRYYDIPVVFNAKMESSQFGYDLYYFCNWIFNKTGIWPKLAIERNTGQATIYVLKQLNYPDLFRMVDFTAQESGTYEKGAIGWTTTGYISAGELKGTRRKMLDDLAMAVRQKSIKFYDENIFKQMKAFKIIKGRAQAARNQHDDLVIAVSGVWQVQELTPDYNFGWNEDEETREARREKWRFK